MLLVEGMPLMWILWERERVGEEDTNGASWTIWCWWCGEDQPVSQAKLAREQMGNVNPNYTRHVIYDVVVHTSAWPILLSSSSYLTQRIDYVIYCKIDGLNIVRVIELFVGSLWSLERNKIVEHYLHGLLVIIVVDVNIIIISIYRLIYPQET